MSEKLKYSNNGYNEDLVVSMGLNVCLTDKITLCDLLRINYEKELRFEVARAYLK